MNRYAPFLTLLLPFGLLVWRPEWTSVATLALWVVLAIAIVASHLIAEGMGQRHAAETEDKVLARLDALAQSIASLETRTAKAEKHIDNLSQARPTLQKGPPL